MAALFFAVKNGTSVHRFWRYHLVYPLLLFMVLLLVGHWFSWDSRIADYIFMQEGNRWSLRNHWLLSAVLHEGGKHLSILLALIVVFAWLGSFYFFHLRPWRRVLGYLFLSAISASALVSLAKHSLAISCPWEFSRYGGDIGYLSLLQQLVIRNGDGCFPAGHASAGYAWFGFYFVGLYWQARWRWLGLALPFLFGVVFGVTQQLRGAHFLSHDLATLLVCWLVALLWYWLLLTPAHQSLQYSVFAKGNFHHE